MTADLVAVFAALAADQSLAWQIAIYTVAIVVALLCLWSFLELSQWAVTIGVDAIRTVRVRLRRRTNPGEQLRRLRLITRDREMP